MAAAAGKVTKSASKRTGPSLEAPSKKTKQTAADTTAGTGAGAHSPQLIEQPNFRPNSPLLCDVTKDGLGWSLRDGWAAVSVNSEGYFVGKEYEYVEPIPMSTGKHMANFAVVESYGEFNAPFTAVETSDRCTSLVLSTLDDRTGAITIGIMSRAPSYMYHDMLEEGHCWTKDGQVAYADFDNVEITGDFEQMPTFAQGDIVGMEWTVTKAYSSLTRTARRLL